MEPEAQESEFGTEVGLLTQHVFNYSSGLASRGSITDVLFNRDRHYGQYSAQRPESISASFRYV
jgi:hypothetical protein